jgi:hypothetical protein
MLSAENAQFSAGMADAKKKVTSLESSITKLGAAQIASFAAFGGVVAIMKSSIETANAYDAAANKLSATSRLLGVQLGFLASVSKTAQDQFKLSAPAANDLTAEVAKLTQKSGDASKAGQLLASVLDLGAARGMTATESLERLKMVIVGTDDGFDRLLDKNQSVIFLEYAKSIGTTVGKLNDMQKALAVQNAILQAGQATRGEYLKFLGSAAGAQYLMSQSMEQTSAALGKALQPAIVQALPAITEFAKMLQEVIRLGSLLPALNQAATDFGLVFNAALSGNFGAAAAQFQMATAAWKKAVADSKAVAAGPAPFDPKTLNKPAPTPTEDVTKEAKRKAKEEADRRADQLRNANQITDNALLEDAIERAKMYNDVRLQGLQGEDNVRERLRAQLGLVDEIYQLRKAAIQNDTSLSNAEQNAQLLALKVTKEREALGLKMTAEQEEQLALAQKQSHLKSGVESLVTQAISGRLDMKEFGAQSFSLLAEKMGGALGGPIGMALASGVGSLFGGLFGGKKKEAEEVQQPVVKGLDAVERAQKETISAIQSQTQALLNPENRLTNLPSSFSIPAYSPVRDNGSTSYVDNNGNCESQRYRQ